MISLLLVDDHELFRSSLRRRLETESDLNPVGEAGTAEQAVVKARALQPDMILLDLLLPRTSGYDAIPSLADVSPDSKVLVISFRPPRARCGRRCRPARPATCRSAPPTAT